MTPSSQRWEPPGNPGRFNLIDGTGRAVTLERGQPEFDGAVVGLGAIGIVHAVTFDVVDAFRLHDVTGLEKLDEVIEHIHDHVASADHVKVWWLGDFAALAARFDPERRFRNAWLDSILDEDQSATDAGLAT